MAAAAAPTAIAAEVADAPTAADAATANAAVSIPLGGAERSSFAYTSCYCEENAYLLIKRLVEEEEEGAEAWAVFVSNRERVVPIWRQRAARRDPGGAPVLWDYHVFAVARGAANPPPEQPYRVYDLDTTIEPFPVAFDDYRRQALRPSAAAASPPRRYRVVRAADLLVRFSSDRSHMRAADGRGWASPPPPWPPIGGGDNNSNTLPLFLDMRRPDEDGDDRSDGRGRVMTEDEFYEFFAAPLPL